jgi:hypothetical protein
MTAAALGALTDGVYFEDRGDGILLIAPARIPTIDVLRPLLAELPGSLRRHNRTYGPCAQIQLRLSSDVGPAISDTLGAQGEAIIRTARLLEATALRKAMVHHRARLGVVVSPFVFDTAIGQPGGPVDSAGFAKIHVHVKETSQHAWMKLIDPASAEAGPVACLGNSRHRTETALPRVQRMPRLLGAREGSCQLTKPDRRMRTDSPDAGSSAPPAIRKPGPGSVCGAPARTGRKRGAGGRCRPSRPGPSADRWSPSRNGS